MTRDNSIKDDLLDLDNCPPDGRFRVGTPLEVWTFEHGNVVEVVFVGEVYDGNNTLNADVFIFENSNGDDDG